MWKVNPTVFVAFCMFIMPLTGPAAEGKLITVANDGGPADFNSIQPAIDDADNGDEIVVRPGTYDEAIDFKGKAVRLYSNAGPAVTTIDATGLNSSVVTCTSGENANTILEGFTITGGNCGMYNYIGSSPTVNNCIFTGNSAVYGGGGMFNVNYCSPTVTNCTFRGNSAEYGGGMINMNSSNPTVTNCIFSENTASQHGGGMSNDLSSPTVTNCTFTNNSSVHWGGGMYNDYHSDPTVYNCIFWGDSPDEIIDNNSTTTVTYSDVQGGWPGPGNIAADPCFVDAAGGDLRLSPGSLCIDVGDNNVPNLPATDIAGNPRIWDGDGNGNWVVDMGAYEFGAIWLVRNTRSGQMYVQIQPAIDDANDYDEIEVSPGTYNEAINFGGKAIRLFSSGGPEITIINATGLNSTVVTCNSGEDAHTILEGFTITGGNASGGGGMLNDGSSPTVTNCIFIGNNVTQGAGGMLNQNSISPTVNNCTFIGNEAGTNGGGMYNLNISSPMVTNCTFNNNTAGIDGGGIFNRTDSYPTVINCTFSGNEAGTNGGGMANYESNPTVINCVLWGNTPYGIYNSSSICVVLYSDVQGGCDGTGNIDADPCFVDANNPDPNLWNLRLRPDSPCIDAGDATVPSVTVDLDGNPRGLDDPASPDTGVSVLGVTVDMGAYEFQPCRIPGDINCDGVVDFKDVAILCNNWLSGAGP
jgi:hypothetical protein